MAELDHQLSVRTAPEAVALLFDALDDPYPPIRRYAGEALSTRLSEAVLRALHHLVQGEAVPQALAESLAPHIPEPSSAVRSATCVALQGSTAPETAAVLFEAARADDADLRYHALVALNALDFTDEHALVTLVGERLKDADMEIVVIAAQIAAARGWGELLEALEAARGRVGAELRFTLSLALAELIAHTPGGRERVDKSLVDELIAEFIGALEDERTLDAATRALAFMGATQAIDALVKVLDRWFSHPILRVGAAAALVELGNARGKAYLADALTSRRKDARGYAMRLVAHLRLEEHLPYLIEVALSDDYHADTAVLALLDFGSEQALATVAEIAQNHPHDDVRELAQLRLAARGSHESVKNPCD